MRSAAQGAALRAVDRAVRAGAERQRGEGGMNAGAIGERPRPTSEARPEGRGFSRELERAAAPRAAARSAVPADVSRGRPPVSSRASPLEVLLRRRREAGSKDEHLCERRDIDRAARLEEGERAAPPPLQARAEPLTAATLAVTVERLVVTLERQQRAEGPSIEMQFGGRLGIRLTRRPAGLELAITGDPAAARQARAELPDLLAKLRSRGLVVVRSEVRASPAASSGKQRDPVPPR